MITHPQGYTQVFAQVFFKKFYHQLDKQYG